MIIFCVLFVYDFKVLFGYYVGFIGNDGIKLCG